MNIRGISAERENNKESDGNVEMNNMVREMQNAINRLISSLSTTENKIS